METAIERGIKEGRIVALCGEGNHPVRKDDKGYFCKKCKRYYDKGELVFPVAEPTD